MRPFRSNRGTRCDCLSRSRGERGAGLFRYRLGALGAVSVASGLVSLAACCARQPADEIDGGHGAREMISLAEIAAVRREPVAGLRVAHALRDDRHPEIVA